MKNCRIIFLLVLSCAACPLKVSAEDDIVLPTIVDEKAAPSYIAKMLKRLSEFEKNLRLKEKYLIVEDHMAELNKTYHDFQEWSGITIHGKLENMTAGQIYEPRRMTKIEDKIYLTVNGELTPNLKYFVSGRYIYDSVFDVNENYPKDVRSDKRSEGDLRDTYLDYSIGNVDLRLGKQQVVWGEAIGSFYADVVNGRDLREHVLPDFEFIRIPEWGVTAEAALDNFHTQLVWLPGIELDKTGLLGSDFAFPLPLPNSSTSFSIVDPEEPDKKVENSKIGGRFSYLFNGYDIGAFYLRSWTSLPVMYRTINAGVYDFVPEYKRQNIFGMTVTKEINDYVCKGEAVYYPSAYFSVNNAADIDGIEKSGYVDYLIGVDHNFFNKWEVNLQLTQRWILDYESTFFGEDEFSTGFSARISRKWLNKKLMTEATFIVNFNAPDYLYQPKVSYSVNDHLQVAVGLDVFAGDSSGTFGYFRNQSRWYTDVTYKF